MCFFTSHLVYNSMSVVGVVREGRARVGMGMRSRGGSRNGLGMVWEWNVVGRKGLAVNMRGNAMGK